MPDGLQFDSNQIQQPFFLTAYQLAVRSNRVKQSFDAYSHNPENTYALNQNQNKAKKYFAKIAISSFGSDRYHI